MAGREVLAHTENRRQGTRTRLAQGQTQGLGRGSSASKTQGPEAVLAWVLALGA